MSRLPIRLRLALVFTAVMAVVLVAFGTAVYLHTKASLDGEIRRDLAGRAADVIALAHSGGHSIPERDRLVQIVAANGRVLAGRPRTPLLDRSELRRARRGTIVVDRTEATRLLAERAPGGAVVVVGTSLHDREHALESLAAALLLGLPLALLLAGAGGYALAAAALRPVEEMRRRAAEGDDPAVRLPVPRAADEVRRLAETLNEMLGRIERAVAHERAFAADASHELRTPLAILRAELDLALRQGTTPAALREAVRSGIEETERLASLVEDLLLLARADHDALALAVDAVPVSAVLARVARTFPAVAVAPGDDGLIAADPQRVEQALANLVRNAVDHGGSRVTLSAVAADGAVELHVVDDGGGLPHGFVDRAFDRFARGETARTGTGAGLGLAIARALAEAHGGSAGIRNRPDGGTDAWLTFPRAAGGAESLEALRARRQSS